mgnify:CR=1 FL=1
MIEKFSFVSLKLEREEEMTRKYRKVAAKPFDSPAQVFEASKRVIGNNVQETLMLWGTDTRNQPLCMSIVGIGSMTQSLAPVNPILKILLLSGATRAFIVHNHPSGLSYPAELQFSKQDVAISQRLNEACELVDIMLADSLIVCDDKYASLRQEGLLCNS